MERYFVRTVRTVRTVYNQRRNKIKKNNSMSSKILLKRFDTMNFWKYICTSASEGYHLSNISAGKTILRKRMVIYPPDNVPTCNSISPVVVRYSTCSFTCFNASNTSCERGERWYFIDD